MFLCMLFTCLSVDPHICICIYADFWGGSHTQQGSLSVTVSQCEFVRLCVWFCWVCLCVCVNVLGYVGLFSQSICFLDLSVDVSFYTFSISLCVCICVPYCIFDFSKWATTSRWCSVALFGKWILELWTAYQYPLWMWRDTGYTFTMFSFYSRPCIVLVFPHLCFFQTLYIFAKVWVKLAKAIHIKMEVTQMCSPCPLTSSTILKSSGNSHYAGEIVWPFTVTADPWQNCNSGITFLKSLRQKLKNFLEFSSWSTYIQSWHSAEMSWPNVKGTVHKILSLSCCAGQMRFQSYQKEMSWVNRLKFWSIALSYNIRHIFMFGH